MSRGYLVHLEWDAEEQVWTATVPALGDLSTFGDTREEALENCREAILGYQEACRKEGLTIPEEGTEWVALEVPA